MDGISSAVPYKVGVALCLKLSGAGQSKLEGLVRFGIVSVLLLFGLVASAQQQVEVSYPYNPDGSEDGTIGSPDLLDLLTLYGGDFQPEGLLVDGTPFNVWVSYVNEILNQQQATIDSLLQLNSAPEFVPCETSDYSLLVSDTLRASDLDCVFTAYAESEGIGVEGESSDDFLDSLLNAPGNCQYGRIRHVVVLAEGCNVIDFTKMSEVYLHLDIVSGCPNGVDERALLLLPKYSDGTRIKRVVTTQGPPANWFYPIGGPSPYYSIEYLNSINLYSFPSSGWDGWYYDCAIDEIQSLIVGQDIDTTAYGWIEDQYLSQGLPSTEYPNGGYTFFGRTATLIGGNWIVD